MLTRLRKPRKPRLAQRLTQRLGLLLLVPIGTVVVLGGPGLVDRVDRVSTAAAVEADTADARLVGVVVQELGRERLLTMAVLASPTVRTSTLIRQYQSTMDSVTSAQASVGGARAARLRIELGTLDVLDGQRSAVLARQVPVRDVWAAYGGVIKGLLGALALSNQSATDAGGARQWQALDAILRANEEASQAGAALLIATVDPALATRTAQSTSLLGRSDEERFAALADPAEVQLLAAATGGPSGRRTNDLIADLVAGRPAAVTVDEGLTVGQTVTGLRRLLRERTSLALTAGAASRAAAARAAATGFGGLTAALLLAVVLLGVAANRSVARPLRRAAATATAIADLAARELVYATRADAADGGPPRLAALTLRAGGELGELASAFNRVQATAALLMEQQFVQGRNVATMFGNIAHRTRSLVSRQLELIDELERDERDDDRLAGLYRLDHLTARLRRSADSLLVIAGGRDDTRLAVPQSLAEVVRSATAEVEGYRGVRLDHVDRVVVPAAVGPDLTLLLAELLENATSFSPPDVPVEVSSTTGPDCVIRIVDHGIGMAAARLEQENRRLHSRERIDVAPTTVLGLFVVGRLARRHGIGVRLLATPGRGVTAEVSIPAGLLLEPPQIPAPQPQESEPLMSRTPIPTQPISTQPIPTPPISRTPISRQPAPVGDGTAGGTAGVSRGGLRRRQPGLSLADAGPARTTPSTRPPVTTRAVSPLADPEAERAAIVAFTEGADRAAAETRPPRRQPGEHLDNLMVGLGGRHRTEMVGPRPPIDPAAERDQLNGYVDALARAADPTTHPTESGSSR